MRREKIDIEKLNRFYNNDCNDEDKSYIEEILFDSTREDELKGIMEGQFNSLLERKNTESARLEKVLGRIHRDLNSGRNDRKKINFTLVNKWILRVSVVVILPLLIFFSVKTSQALKIYDQEVWVEIKAPAWTRTQLVLPDSTIVWLNNNSTLRYQNRFIRDRRVYIKGEAYFDVVKQQNRPFVVAVNDVDITALGTKFNVAAYEDEKNIQVVLEEGRLEFNDNITRKICFIDPDQMLTYDRNTKVFTSQVVESHKYTSWTNGKLEFRNDSIEEVIRRLERWYNVDIENNDKVTKDYRLRATFIDENIEEVLNILCQLYPIEYRIEEGKMTSDSIYNKSKIIITNKK